MDVKIAATAIQNEVIKWRRELHQIPECDFELHKTSQYVKDKLQEMGIDFQPIARTGIVGIIKGTIPGKTIAIRADMDALPIKEETGLLFASTNGFMHACGHDAHMAMLLGAAKILAQNRNLIKGNVKLLFEPAEETTGGAQVMIEEGCLENPQVDQIVGLHIGPLFPEVENGKIGVCFGPMMAAIDSFGIRVVGKGGHVGRPDLAIDPVTAAAALIQSLQTIISREVNPNHGAVISISMIHGGIARNIIPGMVEIGGNVRTLYPADRDLIERRFREVCSAIGQGNQVTVEIDEYIRRYGATINDELSTKIFVKSAEKIIGADNIHEIKEPSMGAEDMSYFLNAVPGTFFVLGAHKAVAGFYYPLHHPKFDLDEQCLWIGSALFVQKVLDYFEDH
jgi:amidohydrolase